MQVGLDLLHPVEQVGALVGQSLAVVGEEHAPPVPLQHRRSGLPFQLLDLLRHGGRREAEDVGRGHDGTVGRTARSDCSATKSIMQRCYIVRSIIIRWCFTVAGTNMGQ